MGAMFCPSLGGIMDIFRSLLGKGAIDYNEWSSILF